MKEEITYIIEEGRKMDYPSVAIVEEILKQILSKIEEHKKDLISLSKQSVIDGVLLKGLLFQINALEEIKNKLRE